MEPKALESLLRRWGHWKRHSIVVGSTGTIEQKIKERMPFGDGNSVSAASHNDGLSLLKPAEDVEQLNGAFMQTLDSHRLEMTLLQYVYVFEWSVKRIAAEGRNSRASIKNRLQRAKGLIEGRLAQLHVS